MLAFSAIPALMRLTRSGMIDALAADYIRTARARRPVAASASCCKHALRNAAMPVVAIAAVQLGFMLGGSIVIEAVFNLPGVGYLAWESISKNDFPVVQAVVLFLALIYIALTLGADLLNAVLDPRLRHGAHARDRHVATAPRRGSSCWRRALLAALVGPALVPHDPFAQDLSAACSRPLWLAAAPGAPVRHRPARPRLPRAAGLRRPHLAADRRLRRAGQSGLIGITLGILGGFFGGGWTTW